jgi:CRISPR-associated protein Cmr6
MRPLYSELQAVTPGETAHAGLVFDKFIDGWSNPPDTKPGEGVKQQFFEAICARLNNSEMVRLVTQRLQAAQLRRSRLVLSRDGKLYTCKTTARLIIGLGGGHPFEAGLTWHPTLGVPYLSGSSIKGMVRALADPREQQGNVGWGDPTAWPDIKHLFGDTDKLGAGSVIVFDAVPTRCPQLDVEIMTPHYGHYYKKPSTNPPADWYSPVPISFLTVAESQEFTFALAPRRPTDAATACDLDKAKNLLEEALQYLGAGGKTAVGYGRFGGLRNVTEERRNEIQDYERRRRQEDERTVIESMSGIDRELAEFTFRWQSAGNDQAAIHQAAADATALYKRLESQCPEEKLKIAQMLKCFYEATSKWTGALSDKQRAKVRILKQVLKESESHAR